jgi:hypothetical protein
MAFTPTLPSPNTVRPEICSVYYLGKKSGRQREDRPFQDL